jgi:hypothetical protein
MEYDPNTDPEVMAARKRVAEAETAAKVKADQLLQDHDLGRAKGQSPEQIAARKRVVEVFLEQHLPEEPAEALATLKAGVDYTQPLVSTNARGIDIAKPKGKGFLGMGRKPAYLLSKRFAPRGESDPMYALEYFPVTT